MKGKFKLTIIFSIIGGVIISVIIGVFIITLPSNLNFTEHTIETNFSQVVYITNADLNGDDTQDILACAYLGNEIAWWEYFNGGFIKHTIDSNFPRAIHAHPEDLDKDGDMDILGTSETTNQIAWWENNAGVFEKHIINSTYSSPYKINCVDIDNDNDTDLITTSFHEVTLWENDGALNFTRKAISSNSTTTSLEYHYFIHSLDLNNDGEIDILTGAASASQGGIYCWRNEGNGNFTKIHVTQNVNRVHEIRIADINRDGVKDIVCGSEDSDQLNWFENQGNFNFVKHTLSNNFDGASAGFPVDLDKDGDMDIIGSAFFGSTLSWFENLGFNNFNERVISNNLARATTACAFDVDNDSDIDIISGAGDQIVFLENI